MRKHISFSEIKVWNECAYKHKLVYLDNIKNFHGSEHTSFGTALHEVCEKAVLKKIKLDQKELEELFNTTFLQELNELKEKNVDLNKKLIQDMRSQASEIIPHIMPALKKTFGKYEVYSAEEEIYESVDNHSKKYKGFIDLVLKTEDGKYHVIDWKTCSWGWDSRRKNDKITTYQLAYYKHFFSKKHNIPLENIDTHFALLKRTAKTNRVEIFKVACGNKKIDNSIKLLEKAVYNIENSNFVKNKLSCTSGFGCEFYNTKHCTR